MMMESKCMSIRQISLNLTTLTIWIHSNLGGITRNFTNDGVNEVSIKETMYDFSTDHGWNKISSSYNKSINFNFSTTFLSAEQHLK